MQINKDAEDTYIKLGINMPYEVMKKYYFVLDYVDVLDYVEMRRAMSTV